MADIYENLNLKLGTKKYFFGDQPTTLDAIVIGHLTCHYYSPLESNRLRPIIKQYDNLNKYIKRNAKDLFGIEQEPNEKKKVCCLY